MDVRVLLFGSTLKSAVTVVVGLGLVLGGATVGGVVGVPGVAGLDNAFGPVNATDTTVYTDLVVHNPNPIGVRLGGTTVDYTVSMNNVTVASGTKRGVDVGTGNSTLHLTTYMQNHEIPTWWVSHVRNGENTSVVVTAKIHSGLLGRTTTYRTSPQYVTTNITSQFNSTATRPVSGPRGRTLLYINRTNATWGHVTNATTPIETRFVLYNPNDVPVTFTKLGYNITMNDIAVGDGATAESITVPSHGTQVVHATTKIRNGHLDDWWVSHLEHNQTTHFDMDFYAVVDAPLPGLHQVRVPLQNATYTKIIRTHIFQKVKNVAPGANRTTTATTSTTSEPVTTQKETATTPLVTTTTTAESTTSRTTTANQTTNTTNQTTTTANQTTQATTTQTTTTTLLDVREGGGAQPSTPA